MGPAGPQGPAGSGADAPAGSLIFLAKGSIMPAGYIYIGSAKQTIPGYGPIEVDIYMKGPLTSVSRILQKISGDRRR